MLNVFPPVTVAINAFASLDITVMVYDSASKITLVVMSYSIAEETQRVAITRRRRITFASVNRYVEN